MPDPSVDERKVPAYYSDPAFTNSNYVVQHLVRALFADSLDLRKNTGPFHGQIHARRGNEQQWYKGAEASFFSCPELHRGETHIELINQTYHSGQAQSGQTFRDGQAVWHREPIGTPNRYTYCYDAHPYLIIQQCKTTDYFVLLDHAGQLYPHLVSPHLLEPVLTTWIATCLLIKWHSSEDVRQVLHSSHRSAS